MISAMCLKHEDEDKQKVIWFFKSMSVCLELVLNFTICFVVQFFALNHRLFLPHSSKSRPGSAKSKGATPHEELDERDGESLKQEPG